MTFFHDDPSIVTLERFRHCAKRLSSIRDCSRFVTVPCGALSREAVGLFSQPSPEAILSVLPTTSYLYDLVDGEFSQFMMFLQVADGLFWGMNVSLAGLRIDLSTLRDVNFPQWHPSDVASSPCARHSMQ